MKPGEPVGRLRTRFMTRCSLESLMNDPSLFFHFVRESTNRHDKNAISVKASNGTGIGYLPSKTTWWLAGLMDADVVRIGPGYLDTDYSLRARKAIMFVEVKAGKAWKTLVTQFKEPVDEKEILHNMVCLAFEYAKKRPDRAKPIYKKIKHLKYTDILPQSMLLLKILPSLAHVAALKEEDDYLARLKKELDELVLLDPVQVQGLTLFPLSGGGRKGERPYVLLQEGVEAGSVVVSEVDRSGVVNSLKIRNSLKKPVLINEGELLVGAKQDRAVNVTVMVPQESEFVVPVSCVEAGRWSERSSSFRVETVVPRDLRTVKVATSLENLAMSGSAASDQGAVWSRVSEILDDLDVKSSTSCMTEAIYQERRKRSAGKRTSGNALGTNNAVAKMPGNARGVMVFTGTRLLGVELYDSEKTFSIMWPKVWESYAVGMTNQGVIHKRGISRKKARTTLLSVIDSIEPTPVSKGAGKQVQVRLDDAAGTGVAYKGMLCALSVLGL